MAVDPLVAGGEVVDHRRQVPGGGEDAGHGVFLAGVAQVEADLHARLRIRVEACQQFGGQGAGLGEGGGVQGGGEGARCAAAQLGGEQPHGREVAGVAGDDHPSDLQFGGDQAAEERSGAAEGDQRGVAGVDPAVHRDAAHRPGHVGCGDPQNPLGDRLGVGQPHLLGERVHGRARGVGVDPHAAGEVPGAQHAQHHRGVHHGRTLAAAAVAGRARLGARAVRADPQQAAGVHVGDRAAAGADGLDVHPRGLQREPGDLAGVQHRQPAVLDQHGVEAGAAHVGADQQPVAGPSGQRGQRGRPGHRSGHDRLEGTPPGLGQGERAAAGAGDQQLSGEPALGEPLGQAVQVGPHPVPDEGVHHGGAGALVLAVLAGDLMGEREIARPAQLGQRRGDRELVGRVRPGVDQTDRDRVHPALLEGRQRGCHVLGGHVSEQLARGSHALNHLQPQLPRHQRRHRTPEQVVGVAAVGPPQLQDVAEAPGGDQPHRRAATLQQRVQPDRGAVHEVPAVGQPGTAGGHVDRVQHPALRR